MEDEITALEQKMLMTYPSSIERRMAAAMASDLEDQAHDHTGGNGLDRIALEALVRYSPSTEASANAIAHYLTIRDNDDLTVTEENVGQLGVALLRTAHAQGDYEPPSKELEQQISADINDSLESGEATGEDDISFQAPTPANMEKAGKVLEEAIMREKGRSPANWTDQVMSAAIAATAGASGEEISSPAFGERSRMAIARYYSENHSAPKTEFLHGITARLSADVRHMSDMSELLQNIERKQEGQPVDKKWAGPVKVMMNRRDMVKNIQHDAAGHYHLLPKSDQTAIQWDLEYGNNLPPESKKRIEAQVQRISKAWKIATDKPKPMPYILRRAHELQNGNSIG